MKQHWQRLVARIDAFNLRERSFLFVAILVCCVALADMLWLSPAQLAYKQTTLRFAAQNTEIQRLRAEVKSMSLPVDASQVVRREIEAATLELDAVNQEIRAVAPLAEGGPALEQALVQFMRRQEGLTLLSTGTIKQEMPLAAGGAAVVGGSQNLLSRRGLELTVAGPYAELVRYVKTLEDALPTLRWGSLQLKVNKQTPELTLQVYVVGVAP